MRIFRRRRHSHQPQQQHMAAQTAQIQMQTAQLAQQINQANKENAAELERIRRENAQAQRAAAMLKEQAEKPKREYDRIVNKAKDIVSRAKRKVVPVFGGQGAGKSTICKYMFGIDNIDVNTGHSHGTTKLTIHKSNKVPFDVVDTIGKMPDVRGMMRVIACIYHRGWDPAALIVVHSGRTGHFDSVASFLQASKINTINFEPKTFYRLKDDRGMSVQSSLEMTVFQDEHPLPRINSMSASNNTIKTCSISQTILDVLKDLTWERAQRQATAECQGISNTLAFYLAKSIVERADFVGSDLAFIDREK